MGCSVTYSLCTFFNITFGGFGNEWEYYSRDHSSYGRNFLAQLLNPIQRVFVSIMPSRLRYGFRYLSKSLRRVKVPNSLKLRHLRLKPSSRNKPTTLAVALSPESQLQRYGRRPPYDPLKIIAYKLHYVDLVNLSLVSKSLHEAIFPTADLGVRSEELRIYTCEDGSKSQCWVCNIQICQVCTFDCNE